ncbi:MAG TPA: hypothetical protein VGW78_02020 [Candidatus Babeliales bacterium]|nr:hypothetical protein [Candidatus Babeliales bacterium]
MQHFMKNLPEPFVGLLFMIFSIIIILDAMGIIYATALVIIGAFIALWYGFILIQGPKKVRHVLENMHIGKKH